MKSMATIVTLAILVCNGTARAQAVKRTLNANDLKNLQIFMEAASAESGKLPGKDVILASLKMEKGAANLVKAIESGELVLTGATERESVWAYEKVAPVSGGMILTNQGVEKLDATEIKKRLGK